MIGYFKSPFGYIAYTYQDNLITKMSFMDDRPTEMVYDDLINDALKRYFNGTLKHFDFVYDISSFTPFQQEVFKALMQIPYGVTKSYKDIAEAIHRPKAYRAVGQACKKNPIGIMIPCHRVIGSDHALTGYSGKDYIHLKEKLLHHESEFKDI